MLASIFFPYAWQSFDRVAPAVITYPYIVIQITQKANVMTLRMRLFAHVFVPGYEAFGFPHTFQLA